ncbi:MAG: nucleotide exchange factor GrpE [Bacteroidales bacterium]
MIGKRKKEEKRSTDSPDIEEIGQETGEEQENQENAPSGSKNGNDSETASAQGFNEQITELNDKYLRLYSELDNYRKRTLKEKIELNKYASADIITKLLPVLDDFERAIRAFDVTTDVGKSLKEGVILIFNKFFSILNQQGLEQMRTAGESFDTDFHEAITNIPAATPGQKGKIVDEVEKGYLLNGKVIRYAKVVVGS